MIGYAEALSKVIKNSAPTGTESCSARQALGRILAQPISSPVDLPPFTNSAMDGFALRRTGSEWPVGHEFEVAGELAAGDGREVESAEAWEIMTGAPVPQDTDRVIPVEQVTLVKKHADGHPARIRLDAAVRCGQNVRRQGSDVERGGPVLQPATVLRPRHLMMLAALGIERIEVTRRPRAAILCTGNELVDDPGQALAAGQIWNSNGPYLAACLQAAGAEVVYRQTVTDTPQAYAKAVRQALDAGIDLLLSSGAVSMGRYDCVPQALAQLNATIHFHKARVRPGKPILLAQLAQGPLVFGLPGNPMAVAVGMRFLVEPALRVMLGLASERPVHARLLEPASSKPGLRMHFKARLGATDDGQLTVSILQGQQSYRIQPLLEANAWAIGPEQPGDLPAGSMLEVYSLGHLDSFGIATRCV